jgi:2-keto-3-deoxy-L-rhamnonate aldolase RhmA
MNWLKEKIFNQTCVRGVWLSSGSHVAAEIAAAAGFDWALVDMEHGVGDESEVLRQIQVLSSADCASVVRVPSAGNDAMRRVLDFGASGVMTPMIDTAEQAAAFVRTLRYPPAGTRGLTRSCRACRYGRDFKDYFQQANASVTAMVQIETAQAVEQADAIAATDGVDVLFIGHSDLSLNLNCFDNYDAPAMRAAEDAVLSACARHGKRAGMLAKASMPVARYREKGFSVLALGSDIGCLKQGLESLLRKNDECS